MRGYGVYYVFLKNGPAHRLPWFLMSVSYLSKEHRPSFILALWKQPFLSLLIYSNRTYVSVLPESIIQEVQPCQTTLFVYPFRYRICCITQPSPPWGLKSLQNPHVYPFQHHHYLISNPSPSISQLDCSIWYVEWVLCWSLSTSKSSSGYLPTHRMRESVFWWANCEVANLVN